MDQNVPKLESVKLKLPENPSSFAERLASMSELYETNSYLPTVPEEEAPKDED